MLTTVVGGVCKPSSTTRTHSLGGPTSSSTKRPAASLPSKLTSVTDVELAAVVGHELVADGPRPTAGKAETERSDGMRELLHACVEDGTSVSLDELAAAAKLGKFQALRAFKRRHGLPPHTYQLCLRLNRARELIKTGMSAAAIATECGFADQSHMIRHFRRFYGYTPATYAKAASRGRVLEPAQ